MNKATHKHNNIQDKLAHSCQKKAEKKQNINTIYIEARTYRPCYTLKHVFMASEHSIFYNI